MCAGTRKIGGSWNIWGLWFAEHQRTGVSHDAFRLGIVLERSRGKFISTKIIKTIKILIISVPNYYINCFFFSIQYELIYLTFGRHRFQQITANLDIFLRRFNEIQYWVITEICMSQNISKRTNILKKMIKLAT